MSDDIRFRTRAITKQSTANRITRFQDKAQTVCQECADVLYDHAKVLLEEVREYPPELQNRVSGRNKKTGKVYYHKQRYKRTFNLFYGWHLEPNSSRFSDLATDNGHIEINLVNDVVDTGEGYDEFYPNKEAYIGTHYAAKVQDATQQRRIHRGRWQTWQEVLRRNAPALNGKIHSAIRRGAHAV